MSLLHRVLPSAEPPSSPSSSSAAVVEQSVGHVRDFPAGTKKEVKVGDVTVLLVGTKKGVYGVGYKCTHYGAPLVNGVLDGCRLKCPWHGAVFCVDTGDVEESPAIDALPSYPLRIAMDGEIFLTVRQSEDNKKSARKHLIPSTALVNPHPPVRTVAIVGGGASGLAAADTLRQAGFQGRVILFTRESNPPYDRTQLSKNPPKGEAVDSLLLRSHAELESLKVELLYGHTVTGLNTHTKTLTIHGKADVHYDDLIIASGSRAHKLNVPGHDMKNIFTIRAPEDAAAVSRALKEVGGGARVVIVGAGFIGLELAVFLCSNKDLARSVDVIGREDVPLEMQFGVEVGRGLQKRHEAAGVTFHLNADVEAFHGEGGHVTAVKVKGKESALPAQLVVVAVGAALETSWLKGSAVELSEKGEVVVDAHFRNVSGVFAAGDVALFPFFAQSNRRIRVEHWAVAQQTGRAAALALLYGTSRPPVDYVPYFWTVQCDKKSVRYCGYGGGYDSVLLDGEVSELKFVAVYCKGDDVLAVASCQRDPFVSQAAELMRMRKMPGKAAIKAAEFKLESFFL